jgi:hypothetical protein
MRKFFGAILVILGLLLAGVFDMEAMKSPPKFSSRVPVELRGAQQTIERVVRTNRRFAIDGTVVGVLFFLGGVNLFRN